MRAALLILASCVYEDRVADVGAQLSPVDERVIHGDTHFAPEQRAAFAAALRSYQPFTRGRVRLGARFDLDDTNYMDLPPPLLYRVWPTPETGNMGGRTEGDIIWWVPDTCPDLQACAMHEVGHLLGMQHVTESGQVMSAHNPSHVFGVADYRECIRVGVCRERAADYTITTMTVDPSVPNVWPEYPR